ncbi:MAG: DUF6678 family protein [Pseudoalteromonas sp.]|uniref:DUF6678 family protein n=1 Tax=unclassified Pseudoalteromonas TaxID=194690 RepID=UPI003F94DB81
MSKVQQRIDSAIANYSVALMNNTKWKHVFKKLTEFQMIFQIAFVREHKYGSLQKIHTLDVIDDHLADGCVCGGPTYFKEIYAVKIIRFNKSQNAATGRYENTTTSSNAFLDSLQAFGRFPIEITEENIYIHGYQ